MADLEVLQDRLGYRFRTVSLLEQAVTHSSHANERNLGEFRDNEQLEFLGDSILGFLVADMLYRAHPKLSEGQLSKLKGFLVSAANLVKFAERFEIGSFLELGRGEEKTGGRFKQTLLVDAFEATLGAVYLDGGLEPVRRILQTCFEDQIAGAGGGPQNLIDFKAALADLTEGVSPAVRYEVLSETGPDHEKLFTVEVYRGDQPLGAGLGLTRKAAEQAAARRAIARRHDWE